MADIQQFLSLRAHTPVVDVRSEGEYQDGHIPGAINIPLLTNDERRAVGTDYKHKGQLEAIKTGFRLVGPRLADMIEAAEQAAGPDKTLLVHCWRGGMRSSNFCQFVGMARIKTHSLHGGYKAYRRLALESFKRPFPFVVIGGYTGSGKSDVLRALARRGEQVVDLETLARHKGSVFGGLMMPPQPTTEQFQNDLFEATFGLDMNRRIWIEDESIAVGRIFLPEDFWRRLHAGPVVEIQVEKEKRIARLVDEYGPADRGAFLQAMEKITKKLGGQHFKAAKEKLLQGDMPAVIDVLLTYYDKAYSTGLRTRETQVRMRVPYDGTDVEAVAEQLAAGEISFRKLV